jgi:hypothetical protein
VLFHSTPRLSLLFSVALLHQQPIDSAMLVELQVSCECNPFVSCPSYKVYQLNI